MESTKADSNNQASDSKFCLSNSSNDSNMRTVDEKLI